MTLKRITISVSEEVASRIRTAAGDTPVSTWVTDVLEEHLDEADLERYWQDFYRDVKPSRQDVRRAKSTLQRLTKRAGRRGAA